MIVNQQSFEMSRAGKSCDVRLHQSCIVVKNLPNTLKTSGICGLFDLFRCKIIRAPKRGVDEP